ncbi:LCP family protein [Oscillospiraceae bacterium 21-37]|jgi:LCP family protein required for cell wall assembly|uniref:LCP family protein n=1 Tax=Eubacteriales TaxID=186802 RepID=UPI001370B873|nr:MULTISPECIES: LCP family protein [unclassified Neglectibacter]NBI17324.1 LytR family transcriptional regulator [Neglectibacter sp. 59]NBJ72789.1 LytR family transcriptional regulator [Neglectibacter sp. X4]NCE80672.1 LytR family transcriptional regulator [Neglectibacter sp. X58]
MAKQVKSKDQAFEDMSSYSSSKEYKKRRKNRRGRTVAKSLFGVLCVLMILLGTGSMYISTELIGDLTTTTITKDKDALGIQESAILDNSIKNIALFGLDSRTSEFKGQSDVIMILTVDNRHHSIKMTSIMRDTRVPIEGQGFEQYIDGWDTKINAAYAYGGPELAIRTLNQHFGLDIEDYVTINFVNMAAIVDAFGGVELEVTGEEMAQVNLNLTNLTLEVQVQQERDLAAGMYNDLYYPEITKEDYFKDAYGSPDFNSTSFQGGKYLLNGNQAVAYGRIRNLGSDYVRVARQQKVFAALVQRLKNISFTEYPGLIKQMMPYCETNLSLDDIIGMAPILTSSFDVQSITVPDVEYETDLYDGPVEEGGEQVYYLIYDVTNAAQRVSAFIYEEGSPYWDEYGSTADSEVGEKASQQ